MTAAPMVSTYSMWSSVPELPEGGGLALPPTTRSAQRDRNLHFGSLIHECLQAWHQRRDLAEVLALIDRLCPNRLQDENQRRDWHLATAMMTAYAARYAAEEFEVDRAGEELRRPHRQSRYRRGVAQLRARRQGGWHRPHRRRALHPRTQDRRADRCGLPGEPLDRLPDHHLLPLHRADDGHPDHRHSLQRAGEGEAPAGQRGDGRGIPGPARGAAGEVENRQDHGEAQDAGVG